MGQGSGKNYTWRGGFEKYFYKSYSVIVNSERYNDFVIIRKTRCFNKFIIVICFIFAISLQNFELSQSATCVRPLSKY